MNDLKSLNNVLKAFAETAEALEAVQVYAAKTFVECGDKPPGFEPYEQTEN